MRPYSAKTARAKRAMKAQEDQFKAEFDICSLCSGRGMIGFGDPFIQLHHLVGGALKSTLGNRRENWLMICNRCHWHHTHGGLPMPKILSGHLLWCKREVDPEWFKPSVILHLKGWKNLTGEWEVVEADEFYRRKAR